jgi:hypothetical protein
MAKDAEGAVNGFTLAVDFQTSAGASLSIGSSETFSATKAWTEYKLGPVAVTNPNVRKVEAAIAEASSAGTGLQVDSVLISVNAFAPMVNSAPGTAENGTVKAAQLKVKTGPTSAAVVEKGMPLSVTNSSGGKPADQYYKMVSRVYDYDLDRSNDTLSGSVTNDFWLYDDDEMAPQTGSQFGGPFGVKINGRILPTKLRVSSGVNGVWSLSDNAIAAAVAGGESPSDAKVGFAVDFYDYSGWRVTGLEFRTLDPSTGTAGATETVLSGGTAAAAGTLAAGKGYSRAAGNTDDYGAENVPSATVGWEQEALEFFELHEDEYTTDAIVTNSVYVAVTDTDNDRAGDTSDTGGLIHVGNFRVMDQDVTAPRYRTADAAKYRGILIVTNVSDAATLKNLDDENYGHYALGGDLSAHNTPVANISERAFRIYDGELRRISPENVFAVSADVIDPTDRTDGRSNTGVKRGTAAPGTGDNATSSALAASISLTNTYLAWETAATNGTVRSNALTHFNAEWSSTLSETKISTVHTFSIWTWTGFGYDETGWLLPSGETSRDYYLRVHAYDADADRTSDQTYAQLPGPKLTVVDDDTQAPTAPGTVWVNDVEATGRISSRAEAEPYWTNSLSQLNVKWVAATDPAVPAAGLLDIKSAGIAGYWLAEDGAAVSTNTARALTGTTTNTAGGVTKVSKNLSGVTIAQGWGNQQLFAVDKDDDRPGDALTGTPAYIPLAFDQTLPTAIGYSADKAYRLVADPDNTDDPTTQFDLTWPVSITGTEYGVGPDDPADEEHYNEIDTVKYPKISKYEILSPWRTYKIYYTNFEESAVAAWDNPNSSEKSWVYQTRILTHDYTNWPSVVSTNVPTDTTAGATPYASLAAVSNEPNQKIRLYDLDFDQHYIVIIVGVDKAGNEGPAGMWSWATNNTIKFAVTAGVVRTTAAISNMLAGANLADIGMALPGNGEGSPKQGAVLHWLAAGQDGRTGEFKHAVNKYYDLIYRDAASFDELGNEQWKMASTAGNSGTSKTNWNYQADAGLETPNRLRFFRASYSGRWQDAVTNIVDGRTVVTEQRPLASEEVYSMNNVVVSEGYNFVSLQGVPYTNTFEGVFGTDTNMWPGGKSASDTNATQVAFFEPGTTQTTNQWFYFGTDGEWHDSTTRVVTRDQQSAGFFARPFSLTLPNVGATNEAGEATGGWWKDHSEYSGAKASKSKSVKAMLWHPIMQVPTNGPVAGKFSQPVDGTPDKFNLLSLNLPVEVHPAKLGLVEIVETVVGDKTNRTPTTARMRASDDPRVADKLYTIDPATKEVRNGSMMYCDGAGNWRWVKDDSEVRGTPIQPNDMLVLQIGEHEATEWTWEYVPSTFYKLPDRHMGRPQKTQTPASGGD